MDQLAQLYFGRDDAESDIAEGGLLRAGFQPTAAYTAALGGKKRLIIGRKGSGKTAICMTLAAANGDGHVTSLVRPDAMSHDEIRRFQLQGVTDELAKSMFWRFMLALQIAKHVVAHSEAMHRKSTPESVRALRKFLTANGQTADPREHEKFWRAIQRLRSLSLGAFGANIKIDIDAPSEGLQTANQLQVIEASLQSALADLACPPGHPALLLLIDKLEQVWSNDPESDAMVTGLLLAAKHSASQFPGVRCVVFLRTDIYDALPFAEKDKFRGDEMRIEWTPESLHELLLARARASVDESMAAHELWGTLFPAQIGHELAAEYLISHTLRRPRDVIQFANLCRDTAEKNGHPTVLTADIDEAEAQFSQWKLQDLASEYGINFPFLADLFVLFQSSGYIISRGSLERRLNTRLETLCRRFPEHASHLTLEGVLDVLYGIGFLGVHRKQRTVYAYTDPALVEPDECRFYLHPCFRQALRSTSATDLRPYPKPVRFTPLEPPGVGRIGLRPVRGSRDYALLRRIERVAERIGPLLTDPELPPETAREIREVIDAMVHDTQALRQELAEGARADVPGEVEGHVRWACGLLKQTATQLNGSGVGDDPRVIRIARTMEDQIRTIAEEAQIRL